LLHTEVICNLVASAIYSCLGSLQEQRAGIEAFSLRFLIGGTTCVANLPLNYTATHISKLLLLVYKA
jgi:hypothetical protein